MAVAACVTVKLLCILLALLHLGSCHPELPPTTSSGSTRTTTRHGGGSTTRAPASSPTIARKHPKRGLAFASDYAGDINNANQSASVLSWQYDWDMIPPAYLATSNIKYIPMQWGPGNIERFVDSVRAQGADTILGFNEPDYVNEANVSPGEAARLWMQYIEPLKAYGVRLGGPAVTAAGTGRPWLQEFFAACSQCTIDFLPVHWYGIGVDGFYGHLWSIRNEYPNLPIWITEYADTSSDPAAVLDFMNATMAYLDELEWVERYAWFGWFRPEPGTHYNLLREDGGLNALGELYTGARTVHTQIITDTRWDGYQTVNGADLPNQPLVTAWPVYTRTSGASSMSPFMSGRLLGVDHVVGTYFSLSLSAMITAGSLIGGFW